MKIERAKPEHRDAWLRLRIALWPDEDAEAMGDEVDATLGTDYRTILVLIASVNDQVVGFAEAAVRSDYVNGCETSPVAFLEGIYVAPAFRKQGVARALIAHVQTWAKDLKLTEFASDALVDNTDSHAMHKALGFEETERVVYFRKSL